MLTPLGTVKLAIALPAKSLGTPTTDAPVMSPAAKLVTVKSALFCPLTTVCTPLSVVPALVAVNTTCEPSLNVAVIFEPACNTSLDVAVIVIEPSAL